MTENLVSIEFTAQEAQQAQEAIQTLKGLVDSKLISLKPKQRQRLPKMSDASIPFVEKVIEYSGINPEFLPPYIVRAELEKDFNAMRLLNLLFQPLSQLVQRLDDTMLATGSESYVAALAYYNSVKGAAKSNVPGAKVVEADLSVRFARKANVDKPGPEAGE